HKTQEEGRIIQEKAQKEFSDMVALLQGEDIQVITVSSPKEYTPDAIFPNNWFSTDIDGNLVVYAMMAPTRRKEKQKEVIKNVLTQEGFYVKRTVSFDLFEEKKMFLEGTGSMILDRVNRVIYAALS